MSTLTKAQVTGIRKQLEAVFAANGLLGYAVSLGNARFDSAQATFQLKVTKKGQQTQEQSALVLHARLDGIDLNKTKPDGEKLVEYHPRKRKYPYISQKPNGSRYKMSAQQAKMYFSAA